MADVLAFWATALLVGALSFPLAFVFFRRFPDGGAGLAMPLGLLVAGWAYFTLRVLDIVPQGRGGAVIALVLLALLSAAVAGRDRRLAAAIRRVWPAAVALAGVFTLSFFVYVAFRSYSPDITGTEQPMDLMYLNATINSEDYPPTDSWLASNPASYYYFGYLQAGLLTSAAGVPASTGYNLALGYTFAAGATAAASLAFALARWMLGSRARAWAYGAAVLAVVFLLLLGTLAGVFEWAAAHGHISEGLYRALGLEYMLPCDPGQVTDCYAGATDPRTTEWYPTQFFFWFGDTRVIPGTITEFPVFSFILGDLHPHLMSIPLVLLAVGIATATWRGRSRLSLATHRRAPVAAVLLALLIGALAFQNAWDVITFAGLIAAAVFVRNARASPLATAVADTLGYFLPLCVVAAILYVPWALDFNSQAGGFYPYVGAGTKPGEAAVQFGPLLLCAALSLTWALRGVPRAQLLRCLALTAWVPLLPFAAWLLLAAAHGDLDNGLEDRTGSGWVTLATYASLTWALAAGFLALTVRRAPAAILLGLLALGSLLYYGTELFLIKDIFFGNLPRLNTVFKLTYQAWMLLAVGGAVAFVVALQRARKGLAPAGWAAIPVAPVLLAGLVYALISIPNRTGGFENETSVDGLAFLSRSNPAEYALTLWVQDNVPSSETVIEGSGRTYRANGMEPVLTDGNTDYSDAGRIAARTGRAAPIGWYFHEVQWRGDSSANTTEFTRRQDLVDTVYTSRDAQASLDAIRALGGAYVVVGALERQKYPPELMPDFAAFLDVVFEADGLRVYRVAESQVVPTS